MQPPVHKLAALAVLFCLASWPGCASSGGSWFAWGKKSPEEVLNIKTPADRVKELHELAKSAPKKKPEEQQSIVNGLAKEIQRENDPAMRRQILRTISAFPTPVATAVLVSGLNDSETEVRILACHALAKQAGKAAVPELSRVLSSDTDLDVRIAAIRALGQTHDPTALPQLAEALADANPAVQYRATEALQTVSGHDFGNDVQAWREYAKNGKTDAPEASLADRLWRRFF